MFYVLSLPQMCVLLSRHQIVFFRYLFYSFLPSYPTDLGGPGQKPVNGFLTWGPIQNVREIHHTNISGY